MANLRASGDTIHCCHEKMNWRGIGDAGSLKQTFVLEGAAGPAERRTLTSCLKRTGVWSGEMKERS